MLVRSRPSLLARYSAVGALVQQRRGAVIGIQFHQACAEGHAQAHAGPVGVVMEQAAQARAQLRGFFQAGVVEQQRELLATGTRRQVRNRGRPRRSAWPPAPAPHRRCCGCGGR
jgi:hypothetical protein